MSNPEDSEHRQQGIHAILYPHRPNVPDFWLLSEIIRSWDENIGESPTPEKSEAAWSALVKKHVDTDSVMYMAYQRALRLLTASNSRVPRDVKAMAQLTALYIEGFLMGCEYKERKLDVEQV